MSKLINCINHKDILMSIIKCNRNSTTKLYLIAIFTFFLLQASYFFCYSDTPMKFAGITMGMQSEDIIDLFLSNEYSYINNNGKIIKDKNEFLLQRNSDTVGYFEHYTKEVPGVPPQFRFTCKSFLLIDSSLIPVQEYKSNIIYSTKYLYNNWEVINPTWLFSDDKLIAFLGQMSIEDKELFELTNSLNKKYGVCKGDKKVSIWTTNNYIIKLFRYQNIMLDLFSNWTPSSSRVSFHIYNINVINNCSSMVEQFYKIESDKLIQVVNNKVKVNGLSLGMKKNDVYDIMTKYYANIDLFSLDIDRCSFKNRSKQLIETKYKFTSSNITSRNDSSRIESYGIDVKNKSDYTQLVKSVIIDDPKNIPDSFKISIPYKDRSINMTIYFWNDRIVEININEQVFDKISDAIKYFINNNKQYITRYKSKPNEFPKEYAIYNIKDDSLFIGTQMGGSWISLISRNGRKDMYDDIYKIYYQTLESELSILATTIANGSIFTWSIGKRISDYSSVNWNIKHLDEQSLRDHIVNAKYSGNDVPFVDLNTNTKVYEYYLVNPILTDNWNVPSNLLIRDDSQNKYIDIVPREFEVLAIGGVINSISATLESSCLKIGKEKKKIISNILTTILNQKYGLGKEISYLNRKSVYWKVNNNLLELVQEGKSRWSGLLQVDNYILSIRRYDSNDIIYTNGTKKGILD